jgi:osmotically-inducible protein OsmY
MMSNDQLAEKVKADLVKTSTGTVGINRDQARNIKVSANNGTVTLKGSVPSEKEKKLVEIRVREIQDVKKVDNQLTVSSDANPASRDLDNGRNLEDRTDSLQR